ncbi:MAG: endonuclease III [Bacteroidales bacterium]|nr:endonuclease III [Bacteroidales bacterium]
MTLKQRYAQSIELLNQMFPNADTELMHGDTFQLLIAVILSAQCTDKRVNEVTPALFEKFPDCQAMAQATPEEVFPYIKSVSYPNSKSKYLVNCSKRLSEVYHGVVPSSVEELQTLQGVGRKTANVIAAIVFHQAKMPVDTHVHRVSRRIGLTNNAKTVRQTEDQLMKNLDEKDIALLHHQLILLGRYICQARKPKCNECKLTSVCKNFISLQNQTAKHNKT